jgi:DNA-binding MarR family transcriptional regulator
MAKTGGSDILRNAGINTETIDVVMKIDALLQSWRRQAAKRELGQKALVELKAGIDLPHFDVLIAIAGPSPYFRDAQGETMVATVAERLNIDPSRASRLVSEMVDKEFARRAVSQADARRTIIELTEKGAALVEAVRVYKNLIMGDYLATWGEGIDTAGAKFASELELLTKSIESKSAK